MPGKRYRFILARGAMKGEEVRILAREAQPGFKHVEFRHGFTVEVPLEWIAPKRQRPERRRRAKKH